MNHTIASLMLALLLAVASPAMAGAATDKLPAKGTISLGQGSKAQADLKFAEIKRKRLSNLIAATAMIEPDARKIAHVTPRIRARVLKLIAEPGQEVKPGDPLAVLSSIELGQAKAEYLKSRVLEQIAGQHLAREERLFKDKIASAKDVLEARANHEIALAQYKSTREALRLLISPKELAGLAWPENGPPLSDFTLTAPIAGTVTKRNLTIGAFVSGDESVMTIIDLRNVWVLVNVFEHDLSTLQIGEPAEITVGAYPDERFNGVVSYIGDTVERSTRTVQARIDVPNPERRLKPGMFANAQITTTARASREVLTAPASAVYEINGQKSVFVEVSAASFAVRPVTLGSAGHSDVEIVSGVREGERVVSEGGLALKAMFVNREMR
ncbi:MAG: efflux RND transporter periplasmic adaptor subunit [Candidatus Binatus sp.]|uniref:efflux RND transporter periplasmic adaptor subunit n=1 Tax=Candidatus Binatus sp. TaxID=2811406 RepID=UPI002726F7CF|nr:efflux RND transporter periplasmic adaptor subunit [Candidatus Binatus sp.]MDO8431428.1 efflux RND transporter periplasmic adaptor subunit [Candidatus Binatus sp.]